PSGVERDASLGATSPSFDDAVVAAAANTAERDAVRAALFEELASYSARNLPDGSQNATGASAPAFPAVALAAPLTEHNDGWAAVAQPAGSADTANNLLVGAKTAGEEDSSSGLGFAIPEARGSDLLAAVSAFDLGHLSLSLENLLSQGGSA